MVSTCLEHINKYACVCFLFLIMGVTRRTRREPVHALTKRYVEMPKQGSNVELSKAKGLGNYGMDLSIKMWFKAFERLH